MSRFPQVRMRRMRDTPMLRNLAQESRIAIDDFIYPIFVTHGRGVRNPIDPMPGMYQLSLDNLIAEIEEVVSLGIGAVLLFGLPANKDPEGTEAYEPNGIIQEAIRVIKQTAPNVLVFTDVCVCEFTDHGHCGIIRNGRVDNDATLELLAKMAIVQAEAGADVVAPSAMMDGQVAAIRSGLDSKGFEHLPIMAYSAKYASSFYGPFRVAADSAPQFGDRHSYQMDVANSREAMREIQLDIEEGADMIMVKPALSYLDVIARARQEFGYPMAAYNVSGEYAMVKAATENEWIDGQRITLEILTSIKRAGADMIISYHAKEAARWLL
ncbi:MAG: porphobilinogen synthase [Chloroflexota bacterium]|nr:porphobilinogen synthase [Chloroflexota bacterium]MCY3638611.1 porphobilinogen synthase [Chloroflexota bacterium]MDE2686190.1 porphobilinogen synthase [Chloroflexota bacterium]MYC07012.1 porphobilinogen synthase [Chloroflexota bacterium]